MITLCMDTSQSFLVLALLQDDQLIASFQEPCWKRQSEELFPQLMKLMEEHHIQPEDIGAVVITEGPGSYTGVRIAMTAAKVFCAMRNVPLYTLGSLQLCAGTLPHARVLMDARGHRAYHAVYENGVLQDELAALDVDEIKEAADADELIAGDGHLIGREDCWPDLAANFLALKLFWKKVENVHLLTPEYLKPSDAYLVKRG